MVITRVNNARLLVILAYCHPSKGCKLFTDYPFHHNFNKIKAAYVSASRRSSACPAKHQCNEDFCGKNALSWAAQLRGDDVQCKPGVAHLWDECDCCQKCARQHGEKCDMMNPCDHTKGLACLVRLIS